MLASNPMVARSRGRTLFFVAVLATPLLFARCGRATSHIEAGKANRAAHVQTPCTVAHAPGTSEPPTTTEPVTLRDMYGSDPGERIRVGAGNSSIQGWVDWEVLVPAGGKPMPDIAPVYGSSDASDRQVVAFWDKAVGG